MLNQKGFAMTEVILFMLIISALVGVFVPKMARIVDVATLNYETKKFQSEAFFVRSLNKSASVTLSIFSVSNIDKGKAAVFKVDRKNYKIVRGDKIIGDDYFLPSGFKISYAAELGEVIFSLTGTGGKKGTYTFTSPLNNRRYLILDNVGRLRISENEQN